MPLVQLAAKQESLWWKISQNWLWGADPSEETVWLEPNLHIQYFVTPKMTILTCMCVSVLACLFVDSVLAKENFVGVPAESLDVYQGRYSLASPELQFLSL